MAKELFFGREICSLQWDLHNQATSRLMHPGNIPGHWHSILGGVEYSEHCAVLPCANECSPKQFLSVVQKFSVAKSLFPIGEKPPSMASLNSMAANSSPTSDLSFKKSYLDISDLLLYMFTLW